MRKYSLPVWWLTFGFFLSIGCTKAYDLYDASRDIGNYNSELRKLNTPLFSGEFFSAIQELSISLSALLIENVDGQVEDVLKDFEDKNISETEKVVIDTTVASKQETETGTVREFLESRWGTLEEFEEELDEVTRNLEARSDEKEKKRLEILKNIDESQKRFTTSLALVVACVGISSLLLGALNLILKYHRSFNYFCISEKDSESIILINNHDKAETILSISFEKASGVYRWKTEIHSMKLEPLSISAFGHVKVAVPSGFIEQAKHKSKSCSLTIMTGDLQQNKGKLLVS
ncbi:hypothetical protein [Vibrio coralliirubri]|uniref:hypothetical protein n=1 Tax=Vibrio coralliirubri TaxID=1516159 RepID=UPI00073EF991|nr:hypothetical protein [Vibrio coralliirubri]